MSHSSDPGDRPTLAAWLTASGEEPELGGVLYLFAATAFSSLVWAWWDSQQEAGTGG